MNTIFASSSTPFSFAQGSVQRQTAKQMASANIVSSETKVTISQYGLDASASAQNDTWIKSELARIKSLPPEAGYRTEHDMDFLAAHDEKFAEIQNKILKRINLTAAETDYEERMKGFVNTMKYLSDDAKALYDELVARGNTDAAGGVKFIGFRRATEGHSAGGPNGMTFDAINTEITPQNIRNLFSHGMANPPEEILRSLEALTQYLQNRPPA